MNKPDILIKKKIHTIRGVQVMIDSDLAELYNVEVKALNQAVKRNKERFPEHFMFQINKGEVEILRSQNVTSSHGGRRYNPYVFTEQGVAMLSAVLKSKTAIGVSIEIITQPGHLLQRPGVRRLRVHLQTYQISPVTYCAD